MPEIEIRFASEHEYERLRDIRDKYGVQWRGMLIQGAKRLEGLRHPTLSRTPREQPLHVGCERLIENEHPSADIDSSVDQWRSLEF